MKSEIRERIGQVNKRQVPQGYKKTKMGIIPYIWEIKSIKDVANVSSGATPSRAKDNYWNGDIPWVTTGELFQQVIISTKEHISKEAFSNTNLKLYPKNTLIIAMYGQGKTRGTIAILKIPSTINQACCAINLHDDYSYKFLFYQLQHSYHHIRTLSNTGNQENLNANIIKNYNVIIPPLLEQEKISKILSTQDKAIELKEKLIKEKQKQKKYLMQNLLTGKIRLKGFTSEWKKYVMGSLGNTYSGLSGKNKDDFGKGKPYIPYTNIFLNPIIDVNELGYVDVLENEKQSKVCYGDIFFTTSSETPEEVGMSSVLLENVDELYLNSFCFGFRLNNFSVLSPIYASHYFRGDTFRNILNRLAQGVTRFNLSKNNLLKSILLLPPLEEQKAITEILSTQDKEIKLLQKELEEEKQKKKALMQLLLTGIVRV